MVQLLPSTRSTAMEAPASAGIGAGRKPGTLARERGSGIEEAKVMGRSNHRQHMIAAAPPLAPTAQRPSSSTPTWQRLLVVIHKMQAAQQVLLL